MLHPTLVDGLPVYARERSLTNVLHNAMIYKIHVCFVQHVVEVFILLSLFLLTVVKNEHLFVHHVRFLTRNVARRHCFLAGKVRDGLVYHPSGTHVLYPLGMTLVVKRLKDDKQEFLDGHTNVISSVALSHDGRLAATGQMTHAGFQVFKC